MHGETPHSAVCSRDDRIRANQAVIADVRHRTAQAMQAIHESQLAIARSDRLILSLSRLMVGHGLERIRK